MSDEATGAESVGGEDIVSRFEGLLAGEDGEQEAEQPEAADSDDTAKGSAEDPDESAESESAESDETADAADSEGEATESDFLEFEVDGQSVRVTPEEYRAGYLRQSDYTRKMQDLSSQREALAAQVASARQQLEAERAEVARLMLEQTEQEPDWVKLASEDPLGYAEIRAKWDVQQQQRQAVAAEQQHRQGQQRAAVYQREMAALEQAEPGLFEGGALKGEAVSGLMEAGKVLGYSAEELGQILDHRAIRALSLVQKALALENARPAVTKKVQNAPKLVKSKGAKPPTSSKSAAAAQARAKLKKTGSVEDAAAAFMDLLED